MGRQSSDQTMVCSTSSIALLQERFRNLQKVKEKREEQQLLKMLSETHQGHHQRVNIDGFSSTRHLEPADHSLSLGLNLQAKQVDNYSYCGMKTQQLPSAIVSSWPDNYNSKAAAKESASAKRSFDHSSSDLDTSLHL